MAKKRPSTKRKTRPSKAPEADAQYRVDLARATFPRGLYDAETRKRLGLPNDPKTYASYVVELNLQKHGGLAAADNAFKDLSRRTIVADVEDRPPVRVSKTYYSCFISMNE